tara:strand:+ start:41 stop:229 length:189 start_codon:yes stop_codon:yes gene_type:complete
MVLNLGIRNSRLFCPTLFDQWIIGPGEVIFIRIDNKIIGINANKSIKAAKDMSKILFKVNLT